ncbi:MAG: hypothetical protein AABX98_06740, partial [Nanoarchaeota archaeon]
ISVSEGTDGDLTGQAAARTYTKQQRATDSDTCCRWKNNAYEVVKCTCGLAGPCTSNCGT